MTRTRSILLLVRGTMKMETHFERANSSLVVAFTGLVRSLLSLGSHQPDFFGSSLVSDIVFFKLLLPLCRLDIVSGIGFVVVPRLIKICQPLN